MKKTDLFFTALLPPLDFLMVFLAGISAYLFRVSPWMAQYRPVLFAVDLPFQKFLYLVVGVGCFLLLIFALIGLYQIKPIRRWSEDLPKIIIGISAGIIIIVFYIFLRREWFNSRFLVLAGWFLGIIFVSFGRFLITRIQVYLIKKEKITPQRVLIIGQDGVSQRITQKIQNEPALGYSLVELLKEPDLLEVKNKVNNPGVDEIILADPNWPKEKILDLIDFCEEKHLVFKFVPNLFQTLTLNTNLETLGSVPLIELKRTALDGWGRIIKRMMDIVGSLFGLVILAPLFGLVAFMIKWDTRGPVFVKLKRVSQDKVFYLYKFRSMVQGAEELKKYLLPYNERKDGPLFKIKNDPRITPVGRILRRYRIDELPQLINVLKGEMSLIGPRPHQPDEIARYQKHHKKVLNLKAGMTGLAQISGSSDLSFEEEVRLDTYYIEHWSLLLDLKILFKTFLILWRDRSAC